MFTVITTKKKQREKKPETDYNKLHDRQSELVLAQQHTYYKTWFCKQLSLCCCKHVTSSLKQKTMILLFVVYK